MATGRSRLLGIPLALLALAPLGCSGTGPLTSRRTMVGSLKASVSQLEFDNEKLRKEVGELKADNARLDNELVREQDANGEVTARLDDAKELLRRQGGDAQAIKSPSKTFEDDDGVPPPVRRSSRSSRKPPAAQIRRPEADPDDRGFDSTSLDRDLGPAEPADDRWLPVARGMGTSPTRR